MEIVRSNMKDNGFYRSFEDHFRGSRDLIKSRLQVYLPFVLKLRNTDPDFKSIDLGCGRGEWLELMVENGALNSQGVDIDDAMLSACMDRGLNAIKSDAISGLQALPAESLSIITGFHIAEHLPFDLLQILVKEALRVLKPGGLLILETPNPENISVGTSSFYLDPTHKRPLPPQLLSFLADHYGFHRTKILRLQESPELRGAQTVELSHVIFGVSPDYALVAQKQDTAGRQGLMDALFLETYGLSLDVLSSRFDARLAEIEITIMPLRFIRYIYRILRYVRNSLKSLVGLR